MNCFSGTWTSPDPKKTAATLKKVVSEYPRSGQSDVDLGGWDIVSEGPGGLRVEYYSAAGKLAQTYNKGQPFTDDLELTISPDQTSVTYKVKEGHTRAHAHSLPSCPLARRPRHQRTRMHTYTDAHTYTFTSTQAQSSSRKGSRDFGVNAKRVNYLAEKLRANGWEANAI